MLLLLTQLGGGLACADEQRPVSSTNRAFDATEGPPRLSVDVVRVIDGDTILVRLPNGATERVRYIGIDTPESVRPEQPVEPYGREAANRNRELLSGAQVELEFDIQERDRYGRLLAYVFADGTLVNRRLVEEGLALAITYAPNVRNQQELLDAQRQARREGVGIWSTG